MANRIYRTGSDQRMTMSEEDRTRRCASGQYFAHRILARCILSLALLLQNVGNQWPLLAEIQGQVDQQNRDSPKPRVQEAVPQCVVRLGTTQLRHPAPGLLVAFSPDGHYLVTGGLDGSVRVWGTRRGELLAMLSGHRANITALAFSPEGTYLATAECDYNLRGSAIIW